MTKGINRRDVIIASGAMLICSRPSSGIENTEGCSAVERFIEFASRAEASSAAWGVSVDPNAVARAEEDLTQLETQLDTLGNDVDAAKTSEVLSLINAAGSSALFLLAVTGAVASGPLLVGSIAFGGGMLIAQAVSSPQRVSSVRVVRDLSISRVGGVLSTMGDEAYVASASVARASTAASNLFGFAGAAFATLDFLDDVSKSTEAEKSLKELKSKITNARSALVRMRDASQLAELRRQCGVSVKESLRDIFQNSCLEVSLD